MRPVCVSSDLFFTYNIKGVIDVNVRRKSPQEPNTVLTQIIANTGKPKADIPVLFGDIGTLIFEERNGKYVLLHVKGDKATEEIMVTNNVIDPYIVFSSGLNISRVSKLISHVVDWLNIDELEEHPPEKNAVFEQEYILYLGMNRHTAYAVYNRIDSIYSSDEQYALGSYYPIYCMREAIISYIPPAERTAGMHLLTSVNNLMRYDINILKLLPTIVDEESARYLLELGKNEQVGERLPKALFLLVGEYPHYCFLQGITDILDILARVITMNVPLDSVEDIAKYLWSDSRYLYYLNSMKV